MINSSFIGRAGGIELFGTLPDALICCDGTPVRTLEDWRTKRRPEILELFRAHMYGRVPPAQVDVHFELLEADRSCSGGRATRKQVVAHIGPRNLEMGLLIYQPNDRPGPVPLFLGLNFGGNHTICPDPAVRLTRSWVNYPQADGSFTHVADEASRGSAASSWPVEDILARGYALATVYCGDLDPDYDDGFQNGIHPLFYAPTQTRPMPDEWGTIGAWAWGLSRALDYVCTDPELDARRVAVMGHSRLGKTALWAAAQDERFAIAISNDSGCGGASLSRRLFGETVTAINERFPHWFCQRFHAYGGHEDRLPIDQHLLVALMAPRAVYIASAEDDAWADPEGEYLSARLASPVYALFGRKGLTGDAMPPTCQPLMGDIGYHIRPGGHAVTSYDWQRFMDFADLVYGADAHAAGICHDQHSVCQ